MEESRIAHLKDKNRTLHSFINGNLNSAVSPSHMAIFSDESVDTAYHSQFSIYRPYGAPSVNLQVSKKKYKYRDHKEG